jgi:thymidylate synthase (FAD)
MKKTNIISSPLIYLISRPTLISGAVKRFLADERTSWRRSMRATNAEEIVELGGRVCYLSFGKAQSPKTNAQYIQNLVRMGHDSVLEHATWTFVLTGVSRAFSHQLVRHRVGFAFSQLSQEYHSESDAKFVMPERLRLSKKALQAWSNSITASKNAYDEILSSVDRLGEEWGKKEHRRAVRSAARSVLPNATETKIVITANARAIRHFLHVRGSIIGDSEMRRVAAVLLRVMKTEAPSIFKDFRTGRLEDGSPIIEWIRPK